MAARYRGRTSSDPARIVVYAEVETEVSAEAAARAAADAALQSGLDAVDETDPSYNPVSTNPQSGVAVSEAVSAPRQVDSGTF